MRIEPKVTAGVLAFCALLAGASPAAAQTAPTTTHQLHWDPALDAAVTLGGAAVWVASELLKDDLAPPGCRWCARNGVDEGVRRALVWGDTSKADRISDVAAFVLLPLTAFGLDALAAAHDSALGNFPEDALLIAEASVIATDVDQLTKFLVGRERPYVHPLLPDEKLRRLPSSDDNLSFFSGHTSGVFSLAAASGTVAELRGYRWAPLTWGVGGAFALTTAYLRIAADRHWLSDVLVGALVGAAIGVAIPCVFHSAFDDPSHPTVTSALRAPPPPAGPTMTFVW